MRAQQCKSLSTLTDSNIIIMVIRRCLVFRCLSLVIAYDIDIEEGVSDFPFHKIRTEKAF